jgi:hypothetical protein
LVTEVEELGWGQLVNGKLLDAAEESGFNILLTGDKRMRNEQNMSGRRIAVVAMSCNNWPLIEPHVQAVVEAVDSAEAGKLTQVWCGEFRPRRRDSPRQE